MTWPHSRRRLGSHSVDRQVSTSHFSSKDDSVQVTQLKSCHVSEQETEKVFISLFSVVMSCSSQEPTTVLSILSMANILSDSHTSLSKRSSLVSLVRWATRTQLNFCIESSERTETWRKKRWKKRKHYLGFRRSFPFILLSFLSLFLLMWKQERSHTKRKEKESIELQETKEKRDSQKKNQKQEQRGQRQVKQVLITIDNHW